MANNVKKINGIAIADVKKLNTIAAADIKELNGEEFTVSVDPNTITPTNTQFNGTDATEHTSICYIPASENSNSTKNLIVVSYRDADNSNYGTVRAASISGTTLTWGFEYVFTSSTYTNGGICYNTGSDVIMVGWSGPSSNTIYVNAATVGTDADDTSTEDAITFNGSAATVDSGGDGSNQSIHYGMIEYNPDYDTATVAYENGGDSGHNYVAAVSVSGTACTVGTAVEFDDTSEELFGQIYDPDIGKTVLVYDNGTKVGARVISQSGTGNRTISLGTEALYGNNSGLTVQEYYGGMPVAYDTSADRHHVLLYDDSASAAKLTYFTVSGTTVTWSSGTAGTISSGTASNNETGGGIAYNAARNRIITYGATASTSGATYNFEYHTVNGTGYTSQGSTTTIETGLRARTIHTTSVQTNSFHANSTIIVYAALGDATNGGRVKFLDPGG
jgi:hypothetical protein